MTVFKFVAKNGRIDYVSTNMENPSRDKVERIMKARWSIEVYHRELKQTFGIERCQARKTLLRGESSRVSYEPKDRLNY